jgi:NAD-dependent SIR2 family protein deacetylase
MATSTQSNIAHFTDRVNQHARWAVLTGAGCSTGSGIPDYRDTAGQWKRKQPIHLPEFMATETARKRYWARSMVGWRAFAAASPNTVHTQLASFESRGRVEGLITQNVDGLHQRAGSQTVIDLHGRLDQVVCLTCANRTERADIQARLEATNGDWHYHNARPAPDGDVDLEGANYDVFQLAHCEVCDGILKPDVVFFGENVPRERVAGAMARVENADTLLVVGSSLMVFSGYRFVRAAVAANKPVFIINQGRTRGDADATAKIEARAAEVLDALLVKT